MSGLGKLLPSLRPESPDLLHLDFLRLLASYGIVLVHFRTNLLSPFAGREAIARNLDSFALCVDLFFVISGFVISWVYRDRIDGLGSYGRFLRKRVARLVPLHWATLLFFVLAWAAGTAVGASFDRAEKYDFDCLVPNLLMIHAWGVCSGPSFNSVSWSISAEMAMYAAFPLLFWAAARSVTGFAVFFAALVAALYLFSGDQFWAERTYNLGVLRAFPGFCFGILLYRHRDRLARIAGARWWLAAAMVLFGAAAIAGTGKPWLLPLAYLIPLLGVAADMQGRVGPLVRSLAPGGRLTYSIYMLHPLVQSVFIVLIGRKLLALDGMGLTVWTLLAFPLVAVVGYLSLFLFEEPARRLMSGTSRRPSVDARGERISI